MAVRIGLVGAGSVAGAHRRAFERCESVELTGVCDADERRAADFAGAFGVEYWTDVGAFVAEAPVDAVDVTLPHDLHHRAATEALDAGKHVLVEKPMATSLADCVDMVERAAARDRVLMVGQMQRFDPRHRGVKALIERGDLGPVRHARADAIQNLRDYADPGHWLFDGERAGGGSVISVAVHKIDLLRYFLGGVDRVVARTDRVDPAFDDAEDYCVALLEFASGALGDLYSTYAAADLPYGESYWLFGDEGVVHALPAEGEAAGEPRIGRGDGFEPVTQVDLGADDPFVNEMRHFADCVASGSEPVSSGRDNLGTMATVFAIYESAERDAPVRPAALLRECGLEDWRPREVDGV